MPSPTSTLSSISIFHTRSLQGHSNLLTSSTSTIPQLCHTSSQTPFTPPLRPNPHTHPLIQLSMQKTPQHAQTQYQSSYGPRQGSLMAPLSKTDPQVQQHSINWIKIVNYFLPNLGRPGRIFQSLSTFVDISLVLISFRIYISFQIMFTLG